MKNLMQRVAREPNALTGLVVAVYGALVAFGVLELTVQQLGALSVLGGAVIFAIRWLVTPASEVVVQRKPDEPTLIAGAAATVPTGAPVRASVTQIREAA